MIYLLTGIIMYGIILQNLINLPEKTIRFYAIFCVACVTLSASAVWIGLVKIGVIKSGIC